MSPRLSDILTFSMPQNLKGRNVMLQVIQMYCDWIIPVVSPDWTFMFPDSLFERTRGFTYTSQPTRTWYNVNNTGGGTRNNVIYLEPFSCMWVAEIFTLHHIVILCASSAFWIRDGQDQIFFPERLTDPKLARCDLSPKYLTKTILNALHILRLGYQTMPA